MASTYLLPHCSVCKKAFKYCGPEPYLLPCLHSVCKKCLNHDCQSISCSRCEESFSKPDYIFLKDTVTQTDIFASHIKKHPSEITCTNKSHMNTATVWCNECQLFFCHACKTSHAQAKGWHVKAVISVTDVDASRIITRKTLCPEHDSWNLDIYDATCEILICSTCASTEHKQCKTKEVELTSVAGDKKALQKEQKRLGTKLQEVGSAMEQTRAKQRELKTRNDDMKKVVSRCFDTLRALVTKREQELLKILENRYNSTSEEIEKTSNQLERSAEAMQVVYDYTGKLLDQNNTGDLLMLQNNVKSRIGVCMSDHVNGVDVGDVMVTFPKAKLAELKTCISRIGDVDSVKEDAAIAQVMYENFEIESDTMEPSINGSTFKSQKCKALTQNGSFVPTKTSASTKQIQDVPKCPLVLFDIEKINTNKAHLSNNRALVNSKLATEKMLNQYVGTTSVNPVSENKLSYWEVNTDIDIDEQIQKYGLLMEIGVVEGEEVDKQYCVSGQPSSRCLSIAHCATHKGICAKVWDKGTKVRCIEDVLVNKAGGHFTLRHGILYNGELNTVVFLDLNKMEVIEELDDAGECSEDLWPIFGVYNSTLASVKMQLVSGADVQLTDEKLSLFSALFLHSPLTPHAE